MCRKVYGEVLIYCMTGRFPAHAVRVMIHRQDGQNLPVLPSLGRRRRLELRHFNKTRSVMRSSERTEAKAAGGKGPEAC